MAEVKVSALTALTGANVANGDELYIVDTGSPNVSKKITADELAQMPQLSSRYAPRAGACDALFLNAEGFRAYSGSATIGLQNSNAVFLFDASSAEGIVGVVTVPDDWTTAHLDLWWTNAGAGSGDVAWYTGVYSIANNGSLTGNVVVETSTADVVTAGSQGTVKVNRFHTGWTVPASHVMSIYVSRQAANVGDTLANDCGVIGVRLVRAS